MQGGGIIDYRRPRRRRLVRRRRHSTTIKAGVFPHLANGQPDPDNGFIQWNAPKELTISNSNLSNFRDVGVLDPPRLQPHRRRRRLRRRSGRRRGEPNQLFLSTTRSPTCRSASRWSATTTPTTPTSPTRSELLLAEQHVLQRRDRRRRHRRRPPTARNSRSHVHFVAMDNIFSNSTTAAIQAVGQIQRQRRSSTTSSSTTATDVTGPLAGGRTSSRSSATRCSATRPTATSSSWQARRRSTRPGASWT